MYAKLTEYIDDEVINITEFYSIVKLADYLVKNEYLSMYNNLLFTPSNLSAKLSASPDVTKAINDYLIRLTSDL